MDNIVILAAGKGSKIWPYNEVRNKVMAPIANNPIISYNLKMALELGVKQIIIVTDSFKKEMINYCAQYNNVTVIGVENSKGIVDSLLAAQKNLATAENFAVL